MQSSVRVLIFGASYGSLLASKLLLAGHTARLVCLPAESDLINQEGIRVRMPIRGREGVTELDSQRLKGTLSASGPAGVDPSEFDLAVLAMQEPQYRAPGVRELLDDVARAKVACMSIMNMPPPPFLARIRGLDVAACGPCYTDATVWDSFDPRFMTLCSPDAQAFRPPDEKVNVLQVRLPTNFKAARFESDAHTSMLRQLEADIDAARLETATGPIEVPVKLRVHESIFVPLAKWAMLLAGNYRCVGPDSVRSIRDAVLSDVDATRSVYEWVIGVCLALGAARNDLVPFEKYANAAEMLQSPSSAARALAAGAPNIERVDRLVQGIAAQRGKKNAGLDETVRLVDEWLVRNRRKG